MKSQHTTSATKNRVKVRHAVSSQFAKFGFGRKDAEIKALFSVAAFQGKKQVFFCFFYSFFMQRV